MEATTAELVLFARKRLRPILDRSGKVLYSSETTLSPGDVYLLGINPGGKPGAVGTTTIEENLDALPSKTTNDYLDEKWPDSDLQSRVIDFLGAIERPVRQVCASNVVFVRTRQQPAVGEFNALADICWPIHAEVIGIVKPKIVVVFGKMPYAYLWYRAGKPSPEVVRIGHSRLTCNSFRHSYSGHAVTVTGIPHLSRFPARPETIEFVRRYLSD